jgi:hypothetical protein
MSEHELQDWPFVIHKSHFWCLGPRSEGLENRTPIIPLLLLLLPAKIPAPISTTTLLPFPPPRPWYRCAPRRQSTPHGQESTILYQMSSSRSRYLQSKNELTMHAKASRGDVSTTGIPHHVTNLHPASDLTHLHLHLRLGSRSARKRMVEGESGCPYPVSG